MLIPHRCAGFDGQHGYAYQWGGQHGHGHLRAAPQLGAQSLPVHLQHANGEEAKGQ